MKAVICTQCGAKIENVFEGSVLVDCGYCGARIMLDERRREREPEVRQVQFVAAKFETAKPSNPTFKWIILAVGALILLPVAMALIGVAVWKSQTEAVPLNERSSSGSTAPAPVSGEVPEKPYPVVNYEPKLSWNGPNDIEHFENPVVDLATVSDLSTEEVIRTVFKNRVVKLRVVINTEGRVDDVKTISGHPILVSAATESARNTEFNSRSKPTTRVLTYTFRVIKN